MTYLNAKVYKIIKVKSSLKVLVDAIDLVKHENLFENRYYFSSFAFESLDFRVNFSWHSKEFLFNVVSEHFFEFNGVPTSLGITVDFLDILSCFFERVIK